MKIFPTQCFADATPSDWADRRREQVLNRFQKEQRRTIGRK